jgi:ABC-type siderophore export system fused ATPase/permease subunit
MDRFNQSSSVDDRYFDAVDRVIRLQAGKIVEEKDLTEERASGPVAPKEAIK